MKLLIIRHGPAGDKEKWEAEGRDDRLRPLTSDGKKKMRQAATGLARLVPKLDLLAGSPLVRAAESASIVASEYGSEALTLDSLSPDRAPEEVVGWLREQPTAQTVALVGHEPQLGVLTGYLLTGRPVSFIELKKSGACLLDLEDPLRPGGGILQWLLTGSALRCMDE